MENSTISKKYNLIDAHIHLAKYSAQEIKSLLKGNKYILLAVSDDLQTSYKILNLSKLYENIIPAVGVHPWNADKISENTLNEFKKLIVNNNIKVLGEIGLDKKFVPETFEKQLEVFKFFLELAKEYDLAVNLHTPNAWDIALNLLIKYDIKNAYFHWYTGPVDILNKIIDNGYFIGINVALKWQDKHRKILEEVNLQNIITESDGPYIYKGHHLSPELIEDLIVEISQIKREDTIRVTRTIKNNFAKYLA